ncbi:MAG TPA: hypothetical protein VEB63_12310 [Chitinophagaceae bacterium]|nr:hypothetical protein [Chitinophagaceae bacterium]
MKNLPLIVILITISAMVSSCRVWNSVFKPKYGCKTDGKNVGAEKILSGDPEGTKAAKKAKKFKS